MSKFGKEGEFRQQMLGGPPRKESGLATGWRRGPDTLEAQITVHSHQVLSPKHSHVRTCRVRDNDGGSGLPEWLTYEPGPVWRRFRRQPSREREVTWKAPGSQEVENCGPSHAKCIPRPSTLQPRQSFPTAVKPLLDPDYNHEHASITKAWPR
jgi:hypothetical protein